MAYLYLDEQKCAHQISNLWSLLARDGLKGSRTVQGTSLAWQPGMAHSCRDFGSIESL